MPSFERSFAFRHADDEPAHERSFAFRRADDEPVHEPETGASTPGKRTLTEDLPPGDAVQRKPGAASQPPAATFSGADWMSTAFRSDLFRAVQRRAGASAEEDPAQVQAAAQRGISGGAQSLPHLDMIQRAFGRHDVSGVKAHLGGEATAGASAMGAIAFATGDHVAFAGTPDLHTAAHEAAHVVQQRAGVHLEGGVGEEGDEHERHADAVADRVVAGQSAEALLDRYAAPGGASPAGRDAPVQGKAVVQRAVRARKLGTQDFKSLSTLDALFDLFDFDDAGKQAYALQMKERLFTTAVFPAAYRAQFDESPAIEQEVLGLARGIDDLIAGAASQIVVSVDANRGTDLANQLWPILGHLINGAYAQPKCPHLNMFTGLAGQGATDYLTFLKTTSVKLREYKQAINEDAWDDETVATNEKMRNRIEDLEGRLAELEGELRTTVTQHRNTNAIVAKLNKLRTDMAVIEKAIDLDHKAGQRGVQDDFAELQSDETEHNSYRPDGGTSDGVDVGDAYENNKACTLFALLAVVPGFMGAGNPEQLHHILRRTRNLRNYDDDAIVAQIRLAAGLKPTLQAGRRLGDFIQKEILDKGDARPAFIADPIGEAHTFAGVWKDGAYRPRDNQSNSSTDIMASNPWKQKQIGSTWML